MGVITKMRKQKAVYWANLGPDGFGEDSYSAPVEIDCRWEDVQEIIKSDIGEEVLSSATVYVDREVTKDGYLKRGALTGTEDADPRKEANAFPVIKYSELPNFKNTETLRTAML